MSDLYDSFWADSRLSATSHNIRQSGRSAFDPFADIDAFVSKNHSYLMRLSHHLVVLASFLLAGCFEQPSAPAPLEAAEVQSSAPAIELAGRVTDEANIFSDGQEASLSIRLEQLELATQHQMVVVTVSSLGGREIEPFTTELAKAWGIGRQDFDDGVVVLVAPNERRVRIAVGYGLESTLTNDLCAEIIDSSMLPKFREGDYFSGVDLGVDALIDALQ